MQKREGPEFHADSTSSSQWLYKIWNCVHEQENTAITCLKQAKQTNNYESYDSEWKNIL